MKKAILFATFILCSVQLLKAQKLNLTYYIKINDSLYTFEDDAFSDKSIQTNYNKLFSNTLKNKNIISIEDNTNRRFEKTVINHITYYSKLLNDGYFKLYEFDGNEKTIYLICSKNDTVILAKKDSIVNQTIINDKSYNRKLVWLSKDHPDLWEKAGKIKFRKDDLSGFITELNQKYSGNNSIKQEKNRFDYLNLTLKGFFQENKKNISLDVLMSHYFVNISPNFSLRYGIRANYLERTEFFPAISTGYIITGPGREPDTMFIYRDHFETMSAWIFESPIAANFEKTNSIFTPYFTAGLAPILYFRKITRTDSYEVNNITRIGLNVFAAAGVKLKLTKCFNMLAEYKYDIHRGLNFQTGIEYYFKLN